jgi:hypothetical protein
MLCVATNKQEKNEGEPPTETAKGGKVSFPNKIRSLLLPSSSALEVLRIWTTTKTKTIIDQSSEEWKSVSRMFPNNLVL